MDLCHGMIFTTSPCLKQTVFTMVVGLLQMETTRQDWQEWILHLCAQPRFLKFPTAQETTPLLLSPKSLNIVLRAQDSVCHWIMTMETYPSTHTKRISGER